MPIDTREEIDKGDELSRVINAQGAIDTYAQDWRTKRYLAKSWKVDV